MSDDKKDRKRGEPSTTRDQADEQPSRDPELENRRRAVHRILAGGGLIAGSQALPGQWTKPVVDSVILPAHAVTSLTDPCLVTILEGNQSSSSVLVRVDGVISPPTGGVDVSVLVEAIGGTGDTDGPFNATSDADGTYSVNNVDVGGGPGITAVRATVSIPGDEDECTTPVPGSGTTTGAPTSSTSGTPTSSTSGTPTSSTSGTPSTSTTSSP